MREKMSWQDGNDIRRLVIAVLAIATVLAAILGLLGACAPLKLDVEGIHVEAGRKGSPSSSTGSGASETPPSSSPIPKGS